MEGKVVKVDFPNRGIIESEGCQIEVKGVLPGQTVSVILKKIRHGKAQGHCMEVLKGAPNETAPQCPHADVCGGCSYQTLPYEEQLALKERQVSELMAPVFQRQSELYGAGCASLEGIRKSPRQFGYRNKMEFTFGDEYKDGPLALGMHKKGSFYDIVPVTECRIADRDFCGILRAVMEYADKKGLSFYHRMRHEGYLRHLLVRKAARTGEILVGLITTTQEEHKEELEELCRILLDLSIDGKIVGIVHTSNDSLADVVQSDRTEVLYGRDYFYEELLGLRFRISEFSFFQTNSLGAEVLYRTVREYIGEVSAADGKKPVIYDLYSGTGTIAQLMAPAAQKVIGVEIVGEAVLAAKENAALNGLDQCEFLEGDVLKVLDDIAEMPDLIILDPPRDGIHPKALQKIIAYGVTRLVYISCKPTSLARDLAVFLEHGYRIERMCCVDMFPGTVHVETVALLQKSNRKCVSNEPKLKLASDLGEYCDAAQSLQSFGRKSDTYVRLSLDMEDYYRIMDAEKVGK